MRGIALLCCGFFPVLLSCGQYLQQFTDEDKDIVAEFTADTLSSPTYSLTARTLSFNVSFTVDRNGSYRIEHAASCSQNHTAAGSATTGSQNRNSTITTSVTISLNDLATYGQTIMLCTQDTAAYKSAALAKSFATALSAMAASVNETNGGGGANISSGVTAAFPVFQPDFVSPNANRGGTVAANGVSNPYSHGVYLDPNDQYRLKYIAVDRGNHRVLIFNQIPASFAATADVVVGQTSFTANSANAGGITNDQGFDQPVHASVSAGGALFVSDFVNNRVVVFSTIPQSNGATASFVIGQSGVGGNGADAYGAGDPRSLSGPYATHAIGGRLYIVDQANDRVVVHNTVPTSTGAAADFVIGKANFSGSGNTGSDFTSGIISNYLNTPYDLAVANGRLYLSDTNHHRVLVFNSVPTASNARPDFVIGHNGPTPVLANQGGSVSATGLNFPTTIVTQNNKLAIADQVNNRILFYDLPITAHEAAATHALGQGISGSCPANCTSAASATTDQGWFNLVKGLIFDNGYIWAADGGKNRVQVLALPY